MLEISKEELVELYVEQGLFDREIAERYGCSSVTIGEYRKKYGILARQAPQTISKISEEVLEEFYVNQKLPAVEIAKIYNCSKSAVCRRRKMYGILVTPRKIRENQFYISKEELIELYVNQRLTDREIGKKCGCSDSPIRKFRKKYGIQTIFCKGRNIRFDISRGELEELYINQRFSDEQIAEKYGCSSRTIKDRRKKYGILSEKKRKYPTRQSFDVSKGELEGFYVNQKLSDVQIARKYGCSEFPVRNLRKKYGILNSQQTFNIPKKTLRELYVNQNFTDIQISRRYGCSGHTIRYWRKKYGILTKGRGERIAYPLLEKEWRLQRMLNNRIGSYICRNLKGLGFSKGGSRWEDLVGYNVTDLKKYLFSTMPKNCTWDDFLSGELQIDHIIPLSAFNYTSLDDFDFRRAWALENLQLLPKEENLSKHTKLIQPFQLGLKIAVNYYTKKTYKELLDDM